MIQMKGMWVENEKSAIHDENWTRALFSCAYDGILSDESREPFICNAF